MLYLKEANVEDGEKEYEFIKSMPENENGFINTDFGISKEEFINSALIRHINFSLGIGLPEGYVPETLYFLWDNDVIVGLFKIRHCLNEALSKGDGHIGYGISKEYRGRGYANRGLKMAVEKAWSIIPEDEIYLCVNKNNPASFKVQINNGAYVHHEDEVKYYTRIRKYKNIAEYY